MQPRYGGARPSRPSQVTVRATTARQVTQYRARTHAR